MIQDMEFGDTKLENIAIEQLSPGNIEYDLLENNTVKITATDVVLELTTSATKQDVDLFGDDVTLDIEIISSEDIITTCIHVFPENETFKFQVFNTSVDLQYFDIKMKNDPFNLDIPIDKDSTETNMEQVLAGLIQEKIQEKLDHLSSELQHYISGALPPYNMTYQRHLGLRIGLEDLLNIYIEGSIPGIGYLKLLDINIPKIPDQEELPHIEIDTTHEGSLSVSEYAVNSILRSVWGSNSLRFNSTNSPLLSPILQNLTADALFNASSGYNFSYESRQPSDFECWSTNSPDTKIGDEEIRGTMTGVCEVYSWMNETWIHMLTITGEVTLSGSFVINEEQDLEIELSSISVSNVTHTGSAIGEVDNQLIESRWNYKATTMFPLKKIIELPEEVKSTFQDLEGEFEKGVMKIKGNVL
jgi:hypothetical protein